MPQKHKTPPRPTGETAAWAYDVQAYARALVALRGTLSDAGREFWTRRKVFDQMDAENTGLRTP